MMTWMAEGHDDEAKADMARARFEVPPRGYAGSLKGTVWDEDQMLAGYDQGGQGIG